MGFPKDFVWGAATAAIQIEGAALEGGKGLSIWDDYTAIPGMIYGGSGIETACDHYHRYREDVALLRELEIPAYRFSISWPRLLPGGAGQVNQKGLDFYDRLTDCLLENHITPYVTLFHWDYPFELYKRGGWLNPDSPKWFAEYTDIVARKLGDRVKNFITFNEPQIFIGLGHCRGVHAPGVSLSDRLLLQAAHNVLLSHGMAVRALRASCPDVKVGYAPCASPVCPATDSPDDIEAARSAYFDTLADTFGGKGNPTLSVSWWSDPVMLGRYPEDGLQAYRDIMPVIGTDDMAVISSPIDFYAQNIYSGITVRSDGKGGSAEVKLPDGAPATAINWPVTPECLYWGPKFLYERYGKPIIITENGLSCRDVVSLDGKVHDPVRIDFLNRYLLELKRAADDGVPVIGYFQWSLMDNFEWTRGYAERFGLIYVDYETQKRTVKDSAYWYRDCIRQNGENL